MDLISILLMISIVLLIILISIMIILGISISRIKRSIEERKNTKEIEQTKLEYEKQMSVIKCTEDLLNFTRSMVDQTTVLLFQEFKDGRDLTKITKANIQHLVEDIARTVNLAINESNTVIDNTLITKEYYNKYIIETTIFAVKKMLNNALAELE